MRLGRRGFFTLVALTCAAFTVALASSWTLLFPHEKAAAITFRNQTNQIVLLEGTAPSSVMLQPLETRSFVELNKRDGPRTYLGYDFQPIAEGTTPADEAGRKADLIFCQRFEADDVAVSHFTVTIVVNVKDGMRLDGTPCPELPRVPE